MKRKSRENDEESSSKKTKLTSKDAEILVKAVEYHDGNVDYIMNDVYVRKYELTTPQIQSVVQVCMDAKIEDENFGPSKSRIILPKLSEIVEEKHVQSEEVEMDRGNDVDLDVLVKPEMRKSILIDEETKVMTGKKSTSLARPFLKVSEWIFRLMILQLVFIGLPVFYFDYVGRSGYRSMWMVLSLLLVFLLYQIVRLLDKIFTRAKIFILNLGVFDYSIFVTSVVSSGYFCIAYCTPVAGELKDLAFNYSINFWINHGYLQLPVYGTIKILAKVLMIALSHYQVSTIVVLSVILSYWLILRKWRFSGEIYREELDGKDVEKQKVE